MRGDAGGKGINVSRVLCALGQPTCALGLLGGGAGDELDQALRQEGVPAAFVRLAAACRVNTKIVDRAAGVTTEFNEMGPGWTTERWSSWRRGLKGCHRAR